MNESAQFGYRHVTRPIGSAFARLVHGREGTQKRGEFCENNSGEEEEKHAFSYTHITMTHEMRP